MCQIAGCHVFIFSKTTSCMSVSCPCLVSESVVLRMEEWKMGETGHENIFLAIVGVYQWVMGKIDMIRVC